MQIQSKPDTAYWLALLHTPKLGPATILKLLDAFETPINLLRQSRDKLLVKGLKLEVVEALLQPSWDLVERDLAWAKQVDNHILTWQDKAYPALLREVASPPLVLFVNGNIDLLSTPQLAMVGSRNPTPSGIDSAYQFAQHLAQSGITVTSGLALGIDAASHEGALSVKGNTIAVLGTGLDNIYPARHKSLAKQILNSNGVIISEFTPETLPKAEHFPRRNRIISGLSMGVLVVEAAVQSGSLITAKYANEQGREVFAIPGSIHNPLARGCHALLKQGAKLVETANDILEELGGFLATPISSIKVTQPIKPNMLEQDEHKLLHWIGFEMTTVDTVITRSGLSADKVATELLMLELKGKIAAVPGGYMRKVS